MQKELLETNLLLSHEEHAWIQAHKLTWFALKLYAIVIPNIYSHCRCNVCHLNADITDNTIGLFVKQLLQRCSESEKKSMTSNHRVLGTKTSTLLHDISTTKVTKETKLALCWINAELLFQWIYTFWRKMRRLETQHKIENVLVTSAESFFKRMLDVG